MTKSRFAERAALLWAWDNGYVGDKLPKGYRDDPLNCPLARATGMTVQPDLDEDIPAEVAAFVRYFDTGWYPELEA